VSSPYNRSDPPVSGRPIDAGGTLTSTSRTSFRGRSPAGAPPTPSTRVSSRHLLAVWLLLVFLAGSVAGCDVFSGGGSSTSPTDSGTATQAATATPAPTPSPSPTPQLVHSVTLLIIGQVEEAAPAGLAWAGLQDAAATLGVTPDLVQAASPADLDAAVAAASSDDGAVVVTVGAAATHAGATAAAAHPGTQYLQLGVAASEGSPSNVHGIVFDQAQTGYLAGFVAGSFSTSGKVAFVGVSATDQATANYAAGFTSGVDESARALSGDPAASSDGSAGASGGPDTPAPAATGSTPPAASISYTGTSTAPEKGRAASAAAIKAGSDVLVAMPDLSGYGAMRDACGRKALIVAIGSDAWKTLPDVQSCLIGSVLERSDVTVRDAILSVAHGGSLPSLVVGDVANGGIAVSDLHVDAPAGFPERLGGVLAAMAAP
jgi:basic membrane protein A